MVNLDDYRSFLLRDLDRRQAKNKSYTLSAYARDLGLSPQRLNQVLKGRTGLSPQAASDIASRIQLNELETSLFLALVGAKHAGSSIMREAAAERIKAIRQKFDYVSLDPSAFNSISQWYHWAGYMLVDIANFKPDIDLIARRLQIPVETAIRAFEKLMAAGLLKKDADGIWHRTSKKFTFSPTISTQEIRNFYRQILEKALHAIDHEPVADRDYVVSIITIGRAEKELVKKKIDDFLKTLLDELPSSKLKDERVYSLAVSLVPLDQPLQDQND